MKHFQFFFQYVSLFIHCNGYAYQIYRKPEYNENVVSSCHITSNGVPRLGNCD